MNIGYKKSPNLATLLPTFKQVVVVVVVVVCEVETNLISINVCCSWARQIAKDAFVTSPE